MSCPGKNVSGGLCGLVAVLALLGVVAFAARPPAAASPAGTRPSSYGKNLIRCGGSSFEDGRHWSLVSGRWSYESPAEAGDAKNQEPGTRNQEHEAPPPGRAVSLVGFPSGLPTAVRRSFARTVVIFASAHCDACRTIKENWQETPADHLGWRLVVVDADQPENYAVLERLERELGIDTPGDLPAVYADGELIYGGETISAEWPEILIRDAAVPPVLPEALAGLQAFLAAADGDLLHYSAAAAPGDAPAGGTDNQDASPRLAMAVLNREGCKNCSRQEVVLRLVEKEFPGLVVSRFDIGSAAGQGLLGLAREHYGLGDGEFGAPPILLWEDGWVGGRPVAREEIVSRLKALPGQAYWERVGRSALEARGLNLSQGRMGTFNLGVIVVGGLIDGINPCAFAVVVFLVSYLTCMGRDRNSVLKVGGSFCAGVFLTYFLIGIGLSAMLDAIRDLSWLKVGLYSAFGAGGLILGFIHARDAIRFHRSGKAKDMDGGLSQETTRKIHGWIRRLATGRFLLLAGLALGAVISVLELACTGQIYLPVLSIINHSGMTGRSVALVVVYCAAFILPLLAVTVLAAAGVRTQAIGTWARRNLVATKLVMAALFLVLGGMMLAMAWQALPQNPAAGPRPESSPGDHAPAAARLLRRADRFG